jgi:hypothetical protein
MNHGCNRRLSVSQPRLPLYSNNSVCQQINSGSGSIYVYSVQNSQTTIFLTSQTDIVHEINIVKVHLLTLITNL